MKHLALGLAILLALLALGGWGLCSLKQSAEDAAALLSRAQAALDAGREDNAFALSLEAAAFWEKKDGAAAVIVDHEPLDRLGESFVEIEVAARQGSAGELERCLALTIRQLRELYRKEQITYYNLL